MKKLTIVATIFIACTITIDIISNKNIKNNQEKISIVKKEKMLSFYKENDAGEYEITTDSNWPTSDYTFDSELSKCENGGELTWNNENNTIIMTGNISDKCYLYFDKASKPKITGVTNIEADAGFDFTFDVSYTSKSPISKIYLILGNEQVDEGTFTLNGDTLSAKFLGYRACNITNFQICIEDINGLKSDNFSFQYTYTCFPAGTKIYTHEGYKNIEKININDKVYSFNELTNKVELNHITKTFKHVDTDIYKINIFDETINVTPHHRFYIKRNGKMQWVEAKDLLISDRLINDKLEEINIIKIEYKKETNVVYNFEVQNNHTYFVSEKNILVHNIKSPCAPST